MDMQPRVLSTIDAHKFIYVIDKLKKYSYGELVVFYLTNDMLAGLFKWTNGVSQCYYESMLRRYKIFTSVEIEMNAINI